MDEGKDKDTVRILQETAIEAQDAASRLERCADMLSKCDSGSEIGTDPMGKPITRGQVIAWANEAMKALPKKTKLV